MASALQRKLWNGSPIIRAAILDPRCVAPPVVRRLFGGADWCRANYVESATLEQKLVDIDVIVLVDAESADEPATPHSHFLESFPETESSATFVILTSRPTAFEGLAATHVCLPADSPIELVHGVMLGLLASRRRIKEAQAQHERLARLTESLHRQFTSIDTELRLASRLQKNFLPRDAKRIGPACFSMLYRPCSFVSGDIFDVLQLDEHHVGFYLADAVGHGVAAGLLTMYIKHAIQPTQVTPAGVEVLHPSTVLQALNDRLAAHELHDAQFITGWYGLLDLRTMRLEYAVAGHPPPLLIGADGSIRELHGEGTLLGLSVGQTFSGESVDLKPTDRLMVYSDGLDNVLIANRPPLPEMPDLNPGIPELLRKPTTELFAELENRLDTSPGSLSKGDDVSVLVVDFD